jgi:hypothetical protein
MDDCGFGFAPFMEQNCTISTACCGQFIAHNADDYIGSAPFEALVDARRGGHFRYISLNETALGTPLWRFNPPSE